GTWKERRRLRHAARRHREPLPARPRDEGGGRHQGTGGRYTGTRLCAARRERRAGAAEDVARQAARPGLLSAGLESWVQPAARPLPGREGRVRRAWDAT